MGSRWPFEPERPPVTTMIVFVVTGACGVLQFTVPGMLEHLRRAPAGLHGDWWRSATALFVQDGGVLGTASNLAFLLVVGAAAECLLGPGRWLACYFGAGLAGELAGHAWQPYGAGNSVAICGLAGALVVALFRHDPRAPRAAPAIVVYWSAALLTHWPPLLVVGLVAGMLTLHAVRRDLPAGRPAAVAATLVGAALLAARDLHGAALVTGVLVAALLTPAAGERGRPPAGAS